jgi:formylglycine-generating enzyme required for sulfatase activity
LIRILDAELRLITPAEERMKDEGGKTNKEQAQQAKGSDSSFILPPSSFRFYQLTHDYLVHSLRDWLSRKQRETRRGRAALRLAERSSLWNDKPQYRHLPSVLEWVNITALTNRRDWSGPQRLMMKRATRVHGLRALAVAAGVAVLLLVASEVRRRVVRANDKAVAERLVDQVASANIAQVPSIVKSMARYRRWTDPALHELAAWPSQRSTATRLRASLALLPVDDAQVPFLYERLLGAGADEAPVLRDALAAHQTALLPKLWAAIESSHPDDARLLPAASALALYDPRDERWSRIAGKVAEALVQVNGIYLRTWLDALRPVRGELNKPLAAIFRDKLRLGKSDHTQAANILADYAGDDPRLLADLLMNADPKAYAAFFPLARDQAGATLPLLHDELAKKATISWDDPPVHPSWTNPNAAVVTKIKAWRGMLTERFAFCQAMPLGDFLSTAETLGKSGYRPVRFRPYAQGEVILAGALWMRDGRPWRHVSDRSAEEITPIDASNSKEDLIPVDVAAYRSTRAPGKPPLSYAALWVKKAAPGDDSRMVVSATDAELARAQQAFQAAGLEPVSHHALQGSDGLVRYSGVWRKTSAVGSRTPSLRTGLTEADVLSLVARDEGLLVDVCLGPRPRVATYSAILSDDVRFEAVLLAGLGPGAHLQRSRELESQGYRMVSLSIAPVSPESSPIVASVWHRPAASEQTKEELAERQARSAIALLRMGQAGETWPLLRHSAEPSVRSFIINWLSPLGADPKMLAAELDRLDSLATRHPAPATQKLNAILFHPDISARRALILALGTYGAGDLSLSEREPMIAKLLSLYENDPDAGIHGAAEWALRQWDQASKLREIDTRAKGNDKQQGPLRWFVNSQGQTFTVIEGPTEFRMGSPRTEPDRNATIELPHRRIIPRRFAIAAKEVTVAEYQEFVKDNPGADHASNNKYSPDPKGPMNSVTWYHAAAYCNWLSRKEGKAECFAVDNQGRFVEVADALRRSGYRLPTEAEWEYACRAGALTPRYYGSGLDLLGRYARYIGNSQDHAWLCGSLLPNDLGLFDMLGNVYEWCREPPLPYQPAPDGTVIDNISMQSYSHADRLLRGGAFVYRAPNLRSADRNARAPAHVNTYDGFRLARTHD